MAVICESLASRRLEAVRVRIEATKTMLEPAERARLALLTREEILVDLFYAGTPGYFARHTGLGHVAVLARRAHHPPAPSASTDGYEPALSYFFGLSPVPLSSFGY